MGYTKMICTVCRIGLTAMLSMLFVISCSDDDESLARRLDASEFEIRVRGEFTDDVSGITAYTFDDGGPAEATTIWFLDSFFDGNLPTEDFRFTLFTNSRDFPALGSYTIALAEHPDDLPLRALGGWYRPFSADDELYIIHSGELTITETGTNFIKGSFFASASFFEDGLVDLRRSVALQGSFTSLLETIR